MAATIDRSRSLDQLEGVESPAPSFRSYLTETCHRLRRKPLRDFTVEDLRIMIGQQISLSLLVPIALERLADEPLAEGDFYPGDLLNSLLTIDRSFWTLHPQEQSSFEKVLETLKDVPGPVRPALQAYRAG